MPMLERYAFRDQVDSEIFLRIIDSWGFWSFPEGCSCRRRFGEVSFAVL